MTADPPERLAQRLALLALGVALTGSLLFVAATPGRAGDPPKGHNQVFSKRWFHAPVADQDCTVCHSMHGPEADKRLRAPIPRLCYQCHEDVAAKDVVHEPVGRGRCTDCHEVHTSDYRPLLTRKVPELCLECHPLDEAHKTRGTVCTGCHGVHSSDTSRFLGGKQAKSCKECHADKVSGGVLHPPAREGKCLTCHFTHQDPRFKTVRFRAAYESGSVRTQTLCDGCHPQALHRDAAFLGTRFRTAKENLHARHVQGPKGLGCSACHDVHATRSAALIEEWVRIEGKKQRPMQYLRFDVGGSCGPSCHGAVTYLRDDRAEMAEDE